MTSWIALSLSASSYRRARIAGMVGIAGLLAGACSDESPIASSRLAACPAGTPATASPGTPAAPGVGSSSSSGTSAGASSGGNDAGGAEPVTPAYVDVDCTDNAMATAGAYIVNNNLWGKDGVTEPYSQCAGVGALGSDGSVAARWTWTWPGGPNEVKGYPEIIFGQKPGMEATPGSGLPKRLDQLQVATTAWSTSSTYTGTGQLAYDMWLTSDGDRHDSFPATPITHEIMIAVEPYGGYGLNRNPAWYIEDTVIDGVAYKIYKADNFGAPMNWRFLVFQMLTPVVAGALDLKPMFAYLQSKQLITGTEYLASIEFGTEIEEGTGDVLVSSFQAHVE